MLVPNKPGKGTINDFRYMKVIYVNFGPAPSWLVSLVGRALHRYRKGHGFKSRTKLIFFSIYLFNRNSHIWFLYIKSKNKKDVNKPVKS